MMRRLIQKHPMPTRLLHWLNVPVLAVMVWSGISISAAKVPYTITIGGRTLLTLFPEAFYREFWGEDLALAMGWHFTFAWLFGLIGVSYLVWKIASGTWRGLVPKRGTLRDAWSVLLRDLGVSKLPPPAREVGYNGAQRIAYTIAVAMMIGLGVTGLAIFRPTQFAPLVRILGGYMTARAEHFWLTIAIVLFVAIHVLQVARAGWNTFRGMVIGVEVVDDSEFAHVEA